MRKIAFVPIRKGSKGIVNKNLRPLEGRALVFWILDTLVRSNLFDEVWLATESQEAGLQVGKRYEKNVQLFLRNDNTATDNASIMLVVKDFLRFRQPDEQDWLCLFQATSPFTTIKEMLKLADLIAKGGYDSAVGCVRMKKFRWSDDGKPEDYTFEYKPRRQDYDGFLVESGSFYAARVNGLYTSPYILYGKVGIVELPAIFMHEIDEAEDWTIAEALAKRVLSETTDNRNAI